MLHKGRVAKIFTTGRRDFGFVHTNRRGEELYFKPTGSHYVGEVVFYELTENDLAPTAIIHDLSPQEREEAEAQIAARNAQPVPEVPPQVLLPTLTAGNLCRLVEKHHVIGGETSTPITLWQGRELTELNLLFPRPRELREDPMRPRVPLEGPAGRTWLHHEWQEFREGAWKPIRDPRKVSTTFKPPVEPQPQVGPTESVGTPSQSSLRSFERFKKSPDRRPTLVNSH